jgi:hypothetical protein
MQTPEPLRGFVQTDLATHEAWKQLSLEKPIAAALMHQLVVLADKDNYVAASHNALAELMGVSKISIRRAMEVLREGNWVQVLQVGSSGTVNVYAINSHVAWRKNRDGLRYATVRGMILLSGSDQPKNQLEIEGKLRQVPKMLQGEQQLPSGDGLPPVSQPSLPGMEPDLPAVYEDGE